MRGGVWIGLAVAMAMGCGSGKTDDFGDDPEKRGAGGTGGGSGATGGAATAVCVPGSTQACFGPGQCPGAQRCTSEGDGWGDCDCGGSETAGTGGDGATGGTDGTPQNGGTDAGGTSNGGSSNGGGSNGGTSNGGTSNGGSGGESCDMDVCGAYCDAATGHCTDDGSRADCMTQCTETRCTTQRGCLTQGTDYFACIAAATPVCIADRSLPGDGDCRDTAGAFFDCLVVPWHCDEQDGACICSRTRDSTASAECAKHKCCVATVSGTACGCDDTEFCADLGPGYLKTDHCPLD